MHIYEGMRGFEGGGMSSRVRGGEWELGFGGRAGAGGKTILDSTDWGKLDGMEAPSGQLKDVKEMETKMAPNLGD